MYEIWIDSEQFSGKRLIQQHRMVNEVCILLYIGRATRAILATFLLFLLWQALGEDVVKSLHGLTIKIGNPKSGG